MLCDALKLTWLSMESGLWLGSLHIIFTNRNFDREIKVNAVCSEMKYCRSLFFTSYGLQIEKTGLVYLNFNHSFATMSILIHKELQLQNSAVYLIKSKLDTDVLFIILTKLCLCVDRSDCYGRLYLYLLLSRAMGSLFIRTNLYLRFSGISWTSVKTSNKLCLLVDLDFHLKRYCG